METDLGRKLIWGAVNHWNTDNPHVHVVVRGVDADGHDLTIDGRYIGEGLHGRAQSILTNELGPRTDLQVRDQLAREVGHERFTSLDRTLQTCIGPENTLLETWLSGKNRVFAARLVARVARLERMGLVTRVSPVEWRFDARWVETLRGLGQAKGIIKRMYSAVPAPDPSRFVILDQSVALEPVDGVVRSKGLHDELSGQPFAVIESVDGRVFYARIDLPTAERIRENDVVRLASRPQDPRGEVSQAKARPLRILVQRLGPPIALQQRYRGPTWLDTFDTTKLPKPAWGFAADLAGSLTQRSVDAGKAAVNAVADAGEAAVNAVADAGAATVNVVGDAINAAGDAIATGAGAIATAGKAIVGAVVYAGTEIANGAEYLGDKIWVGAQWAGSEAWKGAVAFGRGAWRLGGEFVDDVWQSVKVVALAYWDVVVTDLVCAWDILQFYGLLFTGHPLDALKKLTAGVGNLAISVFEFGLVFGSVAGGWANPLGLDPATIIGVGIGLVGWAMGGDAPAIHWHNGGFVYEFDNSKIFSHGITFGRAVNLEPGATADERAHEYAHVTQLGLLGPFYLPAHIISQGVSLIASGEDNPFKPKNADSYKKYNILETGPYYPNHKPWPNIPRIPW